jgi:hypothetical protein
MVSKKNNKEKVLKKPSKKNKSNNESINESINETINETTNKSNKSINKLNNNSKKKKISNGEFIFNKVLSNSLKNKDIFENIDLKIDNRSKFKNMKDYQADFDDIVSFKKNMTKKDIDDINLIIYHEENNDGWVSACIAYHFIKENNDNVQLLGLKPMHGKFFQIKNPHIYENKNILILDLDYNNEYLNELSKISNNVIVIDDHQKGLSTISNTDKLKVFRGRDERHATCAYVWKFFYPKEDVPTPILFIDNDDIKLFLPFFPPQVAHSFSQAIGHRFSHNKNPYFQSKKRSGEAFIELWDILTEKTLSYKYLIFIGKYYDEVVESLKNQIALNAKPATFQGYNVAVLNFNAPGIKKQVGRQIMSNYRALGSNIQFCVLWGYEYTNNCYDITIMDDHRPTSTINLKEIAQKLGYIGGVPKGGGGHQHEAHFYWPRNNKYDIWDLFSKKII